MDPLVPVNAAEARTLYELVLDHLRHSVASSDAALRIVALEAVAHLAALRNPPAGPRVVVLFGPDPDAQLALARALIGACDLPAAEVPITAMSEQGWAGRPLAEWVSGLWRMPSQALYSSVGVVLLVGMEALRMRRGTYGQKHGSGSTEDYRLGKAENVAAMLAGLPLPVGSGGGDWDARRALVIATIAWDGEHDATALDDWGMLPALAAQLATATWIRVPSADELPPALAAREIRRHLAPLESLFAALGWDLKVSPEAVRWAASLAAERGESAAVAATWIADPARARLAEMLASGVTDRRTAIGPDDVVAPPVSRGEWHD